MISVSTPGASNHETGLAFDTSQYNAWKATLSDHGFRWLGSSDVVHFDYVGAGAMDERGADVKAFQLAKDKTQSTKGFSIKVLLN